MLFKKRSKNLKLKASEKVKNMKIKKREAKNMKLKNLEQKRIFRKHQI